MHNDTKFFSSNILPRILVDLILLISVFVFPFWVTVILSLIAIFLFKDFFEIMILFFVIDIVYGTKGNMFMNFIPMPFFLLSILVYFLSIFGHRKLRL